MLDIARLRLYNQRIAGSRFNTADQVVRWLGAMQAQDYQQALWGIGLRTKGSTIADIEKEIAQRKIIRTWPMRGTIHFVPAQDAQWMLRLSAARMIAADKRRQRQLELNEVILERSKSLFYDALRGGNRLPRSSMLALLDNAGISPKNQRGYHILWYASQTGLICLGPMADKQQTFVLLDEWVPHPRQLSREESLAALAKRYFIGHGPATVYDFAWWAGLTITDARAGLGPVKSELVLEKFNDKEYFLAGNSKQTSPDRSHIYLLPGFDEYLLGYKDRSDVLNKEHVLKVVPGKNGIFQPAIVVDGQIVGTWKRTIKKNTLDIALNPFTKINHSAEMLQEAVRRYRSFLGVA